MLPTTPPPSGAELKYNDIVAMASKVVRATEDLIGAWTKGPVEVTQLIRLHRLLREARSFGISIQTGEGLADLIAYAKIATNDPDYDITAGFAAVLAAGEAVTNWIATNLPNNSNENYYGWTYNGADFTTITVAYPQDFAPLLTALIAAIEGQ